MGRTLEGVLVWSEQEQRMDVRYQGQHGETYLGGLHCGDTMDVELPDGRWMATRIEYRGGAWYLVGTKLQGRLELQGRRVRL